MRAVMTRRRLIRIMAAAAAVRLAGDDSAMALADEKSQSIWRGITMGNLTRIDVHHPDSGRAAQILAAAEREIARLEMVFTLYRAESALVRLNRDGQLDAAPLDLVRLLTEARSYSEITGGAFDVTVQPLWQAYAAHFTPAGAAPTGPSESAIRRAAELVDFRAIEIGSSEIGLGRPGMALTLNGIAPGYMTDRIVELLKNEGLDNVLVDLGEIRTIGSRSSGEPWRTGIRDPFGGEQTVMDIPLTDQAIATSAGHGFRFDPAGNFHHIFDPVSGGCPQSYASVSVLAKTATAADALATACHLLPLPVIAAVLRASAASQAIVVDQTGAMRAVTA